MVTIGITLQYPVDTTFRKGERIMTAKSYLRVLHAAPETPAADFYANGNLLFRNVDYTDMTDYLDVTPGIYNIKVFPSGQKAVPVIDSMIRLPQGTAFTLAAVGIAPKVECLPLEQKYVVVAPDKSLLRFAHLSPGSPDVDVILPGGIRLFRNIGYKEVSDYTSLSPGTYELDICLAQTSEVVLAVPGLVLNPNQAYTAYAVGTIGGKEPLAAVIYPDYNPLWAGGVNREEIREKPRMTSKKNAHGVTVSLHYR